MRHIDTLVIHHSACPSGNVSVFRAEHKAKGWIDIGYHAVISNGRGAPDGHIAVGRPYDEVGSGVWGNNTGKLHVCLVGNFDKGDPGFTGRPTSRQLAALGTWLLTNAKRYGPDAGNPVPVIRGHKEITRPGHATACPGSEMPLDAIRRWFKAAFPLFIAGQSYPALDAYIYGRPLAVSFPQNARKVIFWNNIDGVHEAAKGVKVIGGETYIPVSELRDLLHFDIDYKSELDQVNVHINFLPSTH